MPTQQEVMDQLSQAGVSANDLLQYFQGAKNSIEQAKTKSQSDVDSYLESARLENAIYSQSKNQSGNITALSLDNYSINNAFTIEFSLYRDITTGIPWVDRDAEEKEILIAMGMAGKQHFQPSFRVIKMTWSGWDSSKKNHTFYQQVNNNVMLTQGCYAKKISGEIWGHGFTGINSVWGICGSHATPTPGGYTHTHPQVSSASGEVLFVWMAAVSGYVSIDRNNPKWGFYPAINS